MKKSNSSIKFLPFLAAALLAVTMLAACGSQATPQSTPGGPLSFSQDVLPILESRCSACHGESRQSAGLNLTSFSSLMAGGQSGAEIVPGDSASSRLVELISSGRMPKSGLPLSDSQVQTITEWIDAGAQDN